jgi:hypothetical protein
MPIRHFLKPQEDKVAQIVSALMILVQRWIRRILCRLEAAGCALRVTAGVNYNPQRGTHKIFLFSFDRYRGDRHR